MNTADSLRNQILEKILSIQTIFQKIQTTAGLTDSNSASFNSDYRLKLKELKQLVSEFEILFGNEPDDTGYAKDVELFKNQLASLQVGFRRANIQSQLNESLKNKSELFYSASPDTDIRKRSGKSKEDLIKLSTNTTSKLSSVTRELANIVEQSKLSLDVMGQSSQTVQDTHDEFKSMGNVLQTTKNLVSRYGRRETTDAILIILALLLFCVVCFYVVQKRML